MTDLPADRHIEEALRRVGGFDCSVEVVKRDYAQLGVYRSTIELARMIEKYEPVDPDLLIAREAYAMVGGWSESFLAGAHDEGTYVQNALRAIKLAREKGAL